MQSYFANGGMIGSTLDFSSTQNYSSTDPNYANVGLLLSGDGVNSGTVFTDESPSPRTMSVFGNARTSTAVVRNGTASMFFDGTGDYLTTPYSAQLDLLVGSFTIEAWIYRTTTKSGGMRIFSTGGGTSAWSSTTGLHVLLQLSGTSQNLDFQLSSNTTTPRVFTSTTGIALNTWTHVAATFNGTTGVSLFINGVQQSGTITAPLRPSTNPSAAVATTPGESGNSVSAFAGYIDDLRVTKGVVRYISNFTPPAQLTGNKKNSGIWLLQTVFDELYLPPIPPVTQSLTFAPAVGVGGATTTTHTCTTYTPQAGRLLIAVITMGGGTSSFISSVTIGGVTATRRAGRTANDFVQSDFWSAIVPTGTSANVVVTRNTGTNGATVVLISAIGYANTNWVGGTDFDANNASTALMDSTLTFAAGSTGIGVYNVENLQGTATRVWTGLNTLGEQQTNPETPGQLGAVSGDVNLRSIQYQTNLPAGSRTVSFTSSDTTRRRPTFAVIGFT